MMPRFELANLSSPAHRGLLGLAILLACGCRPAVTKHAQDSPAPGALPTLDAAAPPQGTPGSPEGSAADGGASGATGKVSRLSLSALMPSPNPGDKLPSMPLPIAGRFLFYDDFETSMDKWRTRGGHGAMAWHRVKNKSCGGLYTMVLGLPNNAPYTKQQVDADLDTAKPLDLSTGKHPQLQYDLKGIIYPFDSVAVRAQVRRAGGQWQTIGAVANARYPTVVTFTADLSPFVGSKLDLRFHGKVRGTDKPAKGMLLDDVHVVDSN